MYQSSCNRVVQMSKDTHNITVNWQQYTAYTHDTHGKSVVRNAKPDTVTQGGRRQLLVE